MATEKLNVSGWDGGWPTGFVTNIDEPIASADGSFVATSTLNDVVVLDLSNNVGITVLDTVNSISVKVRCKSAVSGFPEPPVLTLDVEVLIGGVSQGTDTSSIIPTSFVTKTLTNAGWDSNWSIAQIDGMQLRITARTSGPGTYTWYIDCIDVDIDYTAVDPITKTPDERDLLLAGKVPDADTTSDFKQERPEVGELDLTGHVPIVALASVVPTGELALAGKPSYLNTLQEQLQISGWDGGWPTGFATNVDEPVAIADGQTVSTHIPSDVAVFDLDNVSTIVDESTVLSVGLTVRARVRHLEDPEEPSEPGYLRVDLLINGISQGQKVTPSLPESFTNRSLTLPGWNNDWSVSELNSMQLRVTFISLFGIDVVYLDTIDVIVEYVPQSPLLVRPPVLDLALSGQAPEQSVDEYTYPAKAALALATEAPTLDSPKTELPAAVVRLLNGKLPTYTLQHYRRPAAATPTLNGKAPQAYIADALTTAVEELDLAGKAAAAVTVTHNHFRFPGLRTLHLIPEAPLQQQPGAAAVGPSRLKGNFTGKAPTLDRTYHVYPAPAPGAVALVGKAVTLQQGRILSVTEVDLSLAPSTPSVVQSAVHSVPEVDLAFTGRVPAAAQEFTQLRILGYAPVLSGSYRLTPAAATLSLAGLAPISGNIAVYTSNATAQYTGHEPSMTFSTSLTPGQPGLISLTIDREVEFIATPTTILLE